MKRILDILAITGSVVGSFLVAIGSSNINLAIIGYMFFMVGGIATLWLLKQSNASRSLTFINGYFLVINLLGIIARVPGFTL